MNVLTQLGATFKGMAKVALLSRPSGARLRKGGRGRIFILGNGPSLRQALEDYGEALKRQCCLAVNFALNSPEIRELRPAHYVLADPHFFKAPGQDGNVDRLWLSIRRAAEWGMTLHVPASSLRAARGRLGYDVTGLNLRAFNAVGVEGFDFFARAVYRLGLGMPRPRNVLIPSLMVAIAEGFDELIVLGADHSWTQTLAVSDDNEVVSIQPHFYAEDSKEEARVRHEYRNYRLHQILDSFTVAFRAYHRIEDYARSRNVKIVNATPGSFIDAFDRSKLQDFCS